MRENWRVSGKRHPIPEPDSSWKLTRRPGGWILAERQLPDGSFERRKLMLSESKRKLGASLSGRLYQGDLEESRAGGSAGAAGSALDLVSQFPGKVRKLLVQAGDKIKAGDPMLLLEAMKMEFAIKAPYDGLVKTVHVQAGQQVSPGQKFLDLEPVQAQVKS